MREVCELTKDLEEKPDDKWLTYCLETLLVLKEKTEFRATMAYQEYMASLEHNNNC